MKRPSTRFIVLTSMCAALYAAGIVATLIPTPWGVGHFRPAVVIPAFFAFIGGPWVAAIGAAIGTFLGDIIGLTPAGLSNPILSLVAGVPANFFGFLTLGYLIKKFNTWRDFVWISLVSLTIGNFIAGFAVAFSLGIVFGPSLASIESRIALGLGLMLYWIITMIPFVLILVPILVRYLSPIAGLAVNFRTEGRISMLNGANLAGLILFIIAYLVGFPLRDFIATLANPMILVILSLIAGIVATIIGSYTIRRSEERKI